MGKLKARGDLCGFCTRIFIPFRIRTKFRVDGRDVLACESCSEIEKDKLKEQLKKDGKKTAKTLHTETPEKSTIILTDRSDYVDPTLFIKPKDQLVTLRTHPDLFDKPRRPGERLQPAAPKAAPSPLRGVPGKGIPAEERKAVGPKRILPTI